MRITLSRGLSVLCLSTVILLMWTVLRQSHTQNFTQTCHHPEEFQDSLHQLAERTHRVLESLAFTHILCYGALWGQIRLSRSLPWEADVEFCLLNEELTKEDEVNLIRIFKKHKLQFTYDSGEGLYIIKDPTFPGGSIQLVVFQEDPTIKMFRRGGWKRRMLPPDCKGMPSLQCFPPRLMRLPLPRKEFGGVVLPVPHEGIELQKYHYPTNWWKEILPKNC